ncbi:MAG: flagellar export chaperone FliS, partial [Proteobacteria bacterium]|nr:flagellar export chaperone FliS [Pseudomonadota bacterium]
DKAVQGERISRAMAIVCEFSNTLDHEIGGEIAADLDALYSFMTRELTRANLKGDRKALETVEDLLSGLRDTWVEAAKIYARENQVQNETDGNRLSVAL